MPMKGQGHGHVSNGPKDGLDNGEDFGNSWRPHAQGYSQPMSTSAPINDPYGYYGPSFPPYTHQPAQFAPGDHSGAGWSNGDPSMTFLGGYGGQAPMGHDSYALDGMFGPSSFGGFGQPSFGYGFHGNSEYPGPWGGLGRAKQYDDYYRDQMYGTPPNAPVGNTAPGSLPGPGTNAAPAPNHHGMGLVDRNMRAMEHSMGALNLNSGPVVVPSTVPVEAMKDRDRIASGPPPPIMSVAPPCGPPPQLPPTSVPPPPVHAPPPPQVQPTPAPAPKRTTWASIASQPAKPLFKGRKTTNSSSPGLPIGTWDTGSKTGKTGVIPPPPAPRPSAWGTRAPPPSQPPPLSPTAPSTFPAVAGSNPAAFPPPQAAISPQSAPRTQSPEQVPPSAPPVEPPPPAPGTTAPESNSPSEPANAGHYGHGNGQSNYHVPRPPSPPGRNPTPTVQRSPPSPQQHSLRPSHHSPTQQPQRSPPAESMPYSNGPVEKEVTPPPQNVEVVLTSLQSRNNYNPREFDLSPQGARFFVIKSYSEDDIHRSIKYEIWCSTEHGNKRLDQAFREREGKGPIYLFYSVNGSGHFCGMAQMISSVDYNSSSTVWAQDKWKGVFKVKWIYVKDVPNGKLRHIKLENNENKPVTNSRDTQEVLPEKGKMVLRELHHYKHTTSIFDDFIHYEQRQMEEEERRHHAPPPMKDDGSRDRRRRDDNRDGREHHKERDNRDRDHRDRDHGDRDRRDRDHGDRDRRDRDHGDRDRRDRDRGDRDRRERDNRDRDHGDRDRRDRDQVDRDRRDRDYGERDRRDRDPRDNRDHRDYRDRDQRDYREQRDYRDHRDHHRDRDRDHQYQTNHHDPRNGFSRGGGHHRA